jgi:hypothetical protein
MDPSPSGRASVAAPIASVPHPNLPCDPAGGCDPGDPVDPIGAQCVADTSASVSEGVNTDAGGRFVHVNWTGHWHCTAGITISGVTRLVDESNLLVGGTHLAQGETVTGTNDVYSHGTMDFFYANSSTVPTRVGVVFETTLNNPAGWSACYPMHAARYLRCDLDGPIARVDIEGIPGTETHAQNVTCQVDYDPYKVPDILGNTLLWIAIQVKWCYNTSGIVVGVKRGAPTTFSHIDPFVCNPEFVPPGDRDPSVSGTTTLVEFQVRVKFDNGLCGVGATVPLYATVKRWYRGDGTKVVYDYRG